MIYCLYNISDIIDIIDIWYIYIIYDILFKIYEIMKYFVNNMYMNKMKINFIEIMDQLCTRVNHSFKCIKLNELVNIFEHLTFN